MGNKPGSEADPNKKGKKKDGKSTPPEQKGEQQQAEQQAAQATLIPQAQSDSTVNAHDVGDEFDRLSIEPSSLQEPLRSLPVTTEDHEQFLSLQNYTKKAQSLTVDHFELLKVIGKGSFGKVMQVRKKDTGKIYAMKVLKKAQLIKRKQVAHTKTERRVLEDIEHPFIVGLRFAFQTDNKLYMVLDYFAGGELFFHLKSGGRFTEERARFYAAEIAMALQCLHENQIVYRDLKPENVLLDEDGHIRLTDFGLSKEGVTLTKLTHTFCGTPEYLAPEVIHGQGYGIAVDWWSLGTLLYEMLTGLPPFYNQNLHMMYEKIIRAKLSFPPHLSPNARSVLSALLERSPKSRLGCMRGLDDLKRHPFFDGIDWDRLYRKQLIPPFRPETYGGKLDTTNIDDEFKRETPRDTPVMASTLKGKDVKFENFTFAKPESNLDDSSALNDDDDDRFDL